MNILELSGDGHVVHGLCFGPEGVAAVGDVMLAQKIALEKFEFGALAIANKDARRGPGVVPEVVLSLLALSRTSPLLETPLRVRLKIRDSATGR